MWMKKYLIICAVGLASCTGNSDRNNRHADMVTDDNIGTTELSTPLQNERYCFIRTEGNSNQDTTTVHFILNNDRVDGEMNWIPYEKDSRRGKLNGTISGDEITAVWHYMQEGMQDTMLVMFRLSSQQLAQKPLKINPTNYKQETDEAADYVLLYKRTGDCDPSLSSSR